MEIKWLEDFVSLAKTQNFSKAASERNVTQPAFSRRIQQLEQWLGVQLIDRGVQPSCLTSEGRQFRETAEEVLRMLHQDRVRMNARGGQKNLTVSFATLSNLSISFFPQWLKYLKKRHGNLATRMKIGHFQAGVKELVDGECDFLVTLVHPRVPLMLDETLYPSIELGRDRLVLISAGDGAGKPVFEVPGAKEHPVPLMAYTPDSFFGRMTSRFLLDRAYNLNLAVAYENPMVDALMAMVHARHGVALVPESSVQRSDLQSGRLVIIGAPAEEELQIRLFRSTHRRRPLLEALWTELLAEVSAAKPPSAKCLKIHSRQDLSTDTDLMVSAYST
jgi:DNA-binding transcriptional LysR family regulator